MIISSTVPRVVFNLRVLSDRYFKTRPLVVGKPDCALPVDAVRVDEGTTVGPGPTGQYGRGRMKNMAAI